MNSLTNLHKIHAELTMEMKLADDDHAKTMKDLSYRRGECSRKIKMSVGGLDLDQIKTAETFLYVRGSYLKAGDDREAAVSRFWERWTSSRNPKAMSDPDAEWQPMDTAPIDGTDLILKTYHGGMVLFKIGDPRPSNERPAYFCDGYMWWISNGHWCDTETEFGDDTPTYIYNPIGWKLDEST